MPCIGTRCHELRVVDERVTWRLIYRVDADAVVLSAVFKKQTQDTPPHIIKTCQQRYRQYDATA